MLKGPRGWLRNGQLSGCQAASGQPGARPHGLIDEMPGSVTLLFYSHAE